MLKNSKNRKMKIFFAGLFLSSLMLSPVIAEASGKAFHMPQATRLVVFNYNPNQTYTILTRPNAVTDIVLSPGEKVEALALGNTVEWKVAKTAGNIFIKPIVPNAYTSGTLVTNKRIYELSLRSSPLNGAWYQRVSWRNQKIMIFNNNNYNNRSNEDIQERNHSLDSIQTNLSDNSGNVPVNEISKIHFGYKISGNAPFKPAEVFNNGTFTWIKLPSSTSIVPVFFIDRDGTYNISNYSINGNYLVVHQLFKKGILVADGYKIHIKYH